MANKEGTALLAAVGCPSPLLRTLGEPIHFAAIRTLLQAGAGVNAVRSGTSLLILAVHCGDVEAVKLLLRYGADVSW